MAQRAAVHNRKFPISALATGARFHPEFQGGHEHNLVLNYSTRDEGIERQLLFIEKGR
jgi:hypothetical protein